METIILILSVVLLAFGILQIILFFKVWGMTNNVRAIKEHMVPTQNLIKEIYKKNPNIESILFDALYEDMCKLGLGKWDYTPEAVRTEYKQLYQKAGLKFPEVFEEINNWEDWNKRFHSI